MDIGLMHILACKCVKTQITYQVFILLSHFSNFHFKLRIPVIELSVQDT